jgi:hypothetical protein
MNAFEFDSYDAAQAFVAELTEGVNRVSRLIPPSAEDKAREDAKKRKETEAWNELKAAERAESEQRTLEVERRSKRQCIECGERMGILSLLFGGDSHGKCKGAICSRRTLEKSRREQASKEWMRFHR